MPPGPTRICRDAFRNCRELVWVEVPEGVVEFEATAFGGCELLSEISLPVSTRTIGEYAFAGMVKLRAITLPSVPVVATTAFAGSGPLIRIRLRGLQSTSGQLPSRQLVAALRPALDLDRCILVGANPLVKDAWHLT